MENQEKENKVENTGTEVNGNKSYKPLAVIAVIVLIAFAGLGALFLRKNRAQSQEVQVQAENTNAATSTNANVKEFTVSGSNFKFEPSTITVNKGDTVKITFKDDEGTHNLVVDGYNVSTRTLSDGSDSVQFVADKTGTFEYYCSIGSHRDLGMKGTFIVQ